MLVTDLDGTLLGNQSYLEDFNTYWVRNHLFRGSLLVETRFNQYVCVHQIYSTGRNLKDLLNVSREMNLLKPDYAICGVGTEIYTFDDSVAKCTHLTPDNLTWWLVNGVLPETLDREYVFIRIGWIFPSFDPR